LNIGFDFLLSNSNALEHSSERIFASSNAFLAFLCSVSSRNAKALEIQAAVAAKEQAAKDVKASALAKLAALGLTQDEVKALVG
jgi:hypothetical protein